MKTVLDKYVEDGLLNRNDLGDYQLYCYTKETFFKKQWDDITKACRGLVLYKGEVVNHPFPKIFNLDEVGDVSSELVEQYLKQYQYHLYHKVNGHLTIVDYVPETTEFLVHTKGSLQPNEMNSYDKQLFMKRCHRLMSKVIELEKHTIIPTRYTFLFESINPTDPHTLYEKEVERYGDDTLVLLGGYMNHEGAGWVAFDSFSLESWGRLAEIPVVQTFKRELNGDVIQEMFQEKNTEGYVIWFPEIDLRVKIKTTDYWAMRFKKDLSTDMIIDKFVAGGNERLWSKYPEEVADEIVKTLKEHFATFLKTMVASIPANSATMTRKEVGISDEFPPLLKFLIFSYMDGTVTNPDLMVRNKALRFEFKGYMDEYPLLKECINTQLMEYMENMVVI